MGGRGKIQVFAGRAVQSYASKVLKELKNINEYTKKFVDLAGQVNVKKFADGEMEVEILNSVRRKDIYIFQNCASRNEFSLKNCENQIELYHLVDALKRAHAETITVFEPFISSSRSDRASGRSSVGLWIHFKTLLSLGVTHIITFQLHSEKSKSMIPPTEAFIDNIPIHSLLKEYIVKKYIKTKSYFEKIVNKNWAFCSVDIGGESLARNFASAFNCQLVVSHKQRDYTTVNRVNKISILTDKSIEGKIIWIVDDMVDTAGSIYNLILELNKHNVKEVNIAVIHPVLSEPGIKRIKDLHDKGKINKFIVTDTLWISEELKKQLDFMEIVSTTHLAAQIVYKTNTGESLSQYFEPIDVLQYLES